MLQIDDSALGRWPTVTLDPEIVFITATAWVLCGFPGSLLHSKQQQPSDIIQAACKHVLHQLKLGAAIMYLNCFIMRLIYLSLSIRQSLFHQ